MCAIFLPQLKTRGWISSLTAGVTDTDGYDCGTYAARFDVTMKLTAEGISHWSDIVQVVFEYLLVLRTNGCPEWVFEELKALADISFRFQEENSAVEKCEELAELMQVGLLPCFVFNKEHYCSLTMLFVRRIYSS